MEENLERQLLRRQHFLQLRKLSRAVRCAGLPYSMLNTKPSMILLWCKSGASKFFFVRGPHKVIQNMSRAGRLTQYDCCGICYILSNQQNFR